MRPRLRMLRTLVGVALLSCGSLATAGIRLAAPNQVKVILVHSGTAESLAPLEQAVATHLGATWVERLVGPEATADRLEALLRDASVGLNPRDSLVVYIGLPLSPSGESILATAQFDPAKPWSGLPLDSALSPLLRVMDVGVTVVFPSCAFRRQSDSGQSQAWVGGIAFCVTPEQLTQVPDALAGAISESAKHALQGTSGNTGQTLALASNAELADALNRQLLRAADPDSTASDVAFARAIGTTRLFFRSSVSDDTTSRLAAELRENTSDVAPAKRFATWIERYRTQRVSAASLSSDLVTIALEPAYADYAVLAVRAMADMKREHHAAPLERVFEESARVEVKREVVLHFSAPLPPSVLEHAAHADHPLLRAAVFERALLRKEESFFLVARAAALQDVDEHVRIMALRAATTLASPSEAADVVRAVASDSVSRPASLELKNEFIVTLGPLPKDGPAMAFLLDTAENGTVGSQTLALFALGNARPDELAGHDARLQRMLEGKLAHEDAAIRVAALKTIGRLGLRSLSGAVLTRLSAPDVPDVERAAAVDALGLMKADAAVNYLARISCAVSLDGGCLEGPSLRAGAIAALGRIGSEQAVDALWQGVRSSHAETRRLSMAALEPLASASAETILRLGPNSPSDERALAIRMLSATGQKLELLVDRLADPDLRVREAALFGLNRKRSPHIDKMILERALRPTDAEPRAAYIAALGHLGDVEGLQQLSRTADAPTDAILIGATHLPEATRGQLAYEDVSRLITSAETPQARAAGAGFVVHSLEDGSSAERRAALRKLQDLATDDPEPSVREAAAASIREVRARWEFRSGSER